MGQAAIPSVVRMAPLQAPAATPGDLWSAKALTRAVPLVVAAPGLWLGVPVWVVWAPALAAVVRGLWSRVPARMLSAQALPRVLLPEAVAGPVAWWVVPPRLWPREPQRAPSTGTAPGMVSLE